MSLEDIADELGYDSDEVDEELQTRLYGAIFFDSQLPESDTTGSNKTMSTDLTSLREANTFEFINAVDLVDTLTHVNSSVTISSFHDDASQESEEFCIKATPIDENLVSDCDSSSSYDSQSSHNDSSCVTIGSSESDDNKSGLLRDWDADDVVLGVSQQSKSMVCNADDSLAIARRLARSRSDPCLWRVNRADRVSTPTARRAARYFDDSVCLKCKQKGHLTSSCENSGPVCIFCGVQGHERDNCVNLYCYICFSVGHSKNDCTLSHELRQSVCKRCGQRGHTSKLCTEIWRQYMRTTKEGKPVRISKRQQVRPRGCCNCGWRNHDADDCRRKMFRSHFPGPLPRRRVLVYDKKDIYGRLRRVMEKKAKRIGTKKMGTKKCGPDTVAGEENATTCNNAKRPKRPKFTLVEDEATVEEEVEEEEKERVEQYISNSYANRPFDVSLTPRSAAIMQNDSVLPSAASSPSIPVSQLESVRTRRKESLDGADFLPLVPASKIKQQNNSHRNIRHQTFHPWQRNTSDNMNPFAWINRNTSLHMMNEGSREGFRRNGNSNFSQQPLPSISYHDRWRRANRWRDEDQPKKVRSSKTCPSLLSLESDTPYNSRRSRKKQQLQRKREKSRDREMSSSKKGKKPKMSREQKAPAASNEPQPCNRGATSLDGKTSHAQQRCVTTSGEDSRSTCKVNKSNSDDSWLAFVKRSDDLDVWD